MKRPKYLKKGDKIGIIAPAGKICNEKIKSAIDIFNGWGLKVVFGKHLFSEYFQFSATQKQRLSDLQIMLDEETIRAIVCARGGYGVIHLIDELDFTHFAKQPKWIIGFSDISILHSHIHQNFGIESIHATMPVNMDRNTTESIDTLKNVLFGNEIRYELPTTTECRTGNATGILIGGNLSVLCSLLGSSSDINTKGKILFLEDVDEYLYHIERMMLSLKRANKLNNLEALIIGGLTDLKDNENTFYKKVQEIIKCVVEEYDYPVLFNFPAGHQFDNRALVIGRKAFLTVKSKNAVLWQEG